MPLAVMQDLSPDQVAKFVNSFTECRELICRSTRCGRIPTATWRFIRWVICVARINRRTIATSCPDYAGIDGLEGVFDRRLRGEAGAKTIRVNNISYRASEDVWA